MIGYQNRYVLQRTYLSGLICHFSNNLSIVCFFVGLSFIHWSGHCPSSNGHIKRRTHLHVPHLFSCSLYTWCFVGLGFNPLTLQQDLFAGPGFEPLTSQHDLFRRHRVHFPGQIECFRPAVSLAYVNCSHEWSKSGTANKKLLLEVKGPVCMTGGPCSMGK